MLSDIGVYLFKYRELQEVNYQQCHALHYLTVTYPHRRVYLQHC